MNTIINALKDEIDNHLSNIPGYTFLKSASTTLQVIKKRRAQEFLEFMKQHEQRFVVALINNECFVSGLSLTLRQVIEQYSEYKRSRIYNIFLGFTDSEDKESFELEKMYNVLNLISFSDLEKLKTFKTFTASGMNSKEEDVSGLLALGCINMNIDYITPDINIRNEDESSETYWVIENIKNSLEDGVPNEMHISYHLTEFGKKFKNFVFSS